MGGSRGYLKNHWADLAEILQVVVMANEIKRNFFFVNFFFMELSLEKLFLTFNAITLLIFFQSSKHFQGMFITHISGVYSKIRVL